MDEATTQIKDTWREKRLFNSRVIICSIIAIALTGVVLTRLVILQYVNADYYAAQSQGNRIRVQPLPPTRGLIFDRTRKILAENTPSYQLEVTPEQVLDIDDTLSRLQQLGLVEADELERIHNLIRSKRRFDSIPILQRMTDEEVATFAVQRPYFPGVEIRARLARTYPFGSLAAHAIGYVGGISATDQQALDPAAYAGTAYVGKVSVERSYEPELHGKVGHQDVLVNVHGRVMQILDTEPSQPGSDLILSIDIAVQQVAEQALGDYRGSVVAIDPNNGEILALASTPTYNPNAFVSGLSRADFKDLQTDVDMPLFNRALRGRYPPGSTIKPILALSGLEQQVITADTPRYCRGFFSLPGSSHKYRDWKIAGHGDVDMYDAVAQSCDTYFYELANELGIDAMSETLAAFGLGSASGLDIGPEGAGLVPSRAWKRRNFANSEDQVWYPGETIIAGIGQGYLLATPVQLANATAAIAMRGTRYRPSLVHALRDPVTGELAVRKPRPLKSVEIDNPAYWDQIIESMKRVMYDPKGTGRNIANKTQWVMAGKSGTAQVFSVAQDATYDEEDLAERMRDHALFIAFAPVDKPRIAVAVIVENGGSGSGVAGPMAQQVMDAYLNAATP